MSPRSPHTSLPTHVPFNTLPTDLRVLSKDAATRTQHRETGLVWGLVGDAALKAASLASCKTDSPHQAPSSSPKATPNLPWVARHENQVPSVSTSHNYSLLLETNKQESSANVSTFKTRTLWVHM